MEALKCLVALLEAETIEDINIAAMKLNDETSRLRWTKLHDLEREVQSHLYSSQNVQAGRGAFVQDGRNEDQEKIEDVPFDNSCHR